LFLYPGWKAIERRPHLPSSDTIELMSRKGVPRIFPLLRIRMTPRFSTDEVARELAGGRDHVDGLVQSRGAEGEPASGRRDGGKAQGEDQRDGHRQHDQGSESERVLAEVRTVSHA
jgi:hypothetical protein